MIVEDGTGLPDANSYASLEAAETFHSDRQTTVWTSSFDDDAKNAALINATDFIDATYRFKGDKVSRTQALSNPRREHRHRHHFPLYSWSAGAYLIEPPEPAPTGLDPLLAKATMMMAANYLAGTVADTIAAKEVQIDKTIAGPVESTTTYRADRSSDPFPDITGVLLPLLSGGPGSSIGTFAR